MKNKGFILPLFIFIIALLTVVSIFVLPNFNTNKNLDWDEDYHKSSKQPYGTYILHQILPEAFGSGELTEIDDTLGVFFVENEMPKNTNYVFVGNHYNTHEREMELLFEYVGAGNEAFISSEGFLDYQFINFYQDKIVQNPQMVEADFAAALGSAAAVGSDLITTLNQMTGATLENVPADRLGLYLPEVRKGRVAAYERVLYFEKQTITHTSVFTPATQEYPDVRFLGGIKVEEAAFELLDKGEYTEETKEVEKRGYNVDLSKAYKADQTLLYNFVRFRYGKGHFYIHTFPQAFANHQLLKAEGYDYVKAIFSHLPQQKTYWDERSKFYKQPPSQVPFTRYESKELSYILSQPPLKFAYYTLLIAALLYIFFAGKRKQRIIPILEEKTNTSLEFAKTVGTLYFQEQDHVRLAELKIKLFWDFVRNKYQIETQVRNPDFYRKLAQKAQISETYLSQIQKLIEVVERARQARIQISAEKLMALHEHLTYFYKKSK
ncbi:DUF4350 domain-containing protein [Hugenholtzia roseola]|uniref:DUF4350 domain-containing protein n=1 Tax=Hugenholtzia roseola TaxID=1002 RepID=UPI00047BCB52|nr:DUF4350 domain-containing protein [Hugenholtzia roseola]